MEAYFPAAILQQPVPTLQKTFEENMSFCFGRIVTFCFHKLNYISETEAQEAELEVAEVKILGHDIQVTRMSREVSLGTVGRWLDVI